MVKKQKPARVLAEYVGQVRMNREGLVFVRVEGQDEDIYVRAAKSRGALHEDTVRVVETKAAGGAVYLPLKAEDTLWAERLLQAPARSTAAFETIFRKYEASRVAGDIVRIYGS